MSETEFGKSLSPINIISCCTSNQTNGPELKQFHFHTPLEHTIDNSKQYAMKMHLVHLNAENEIDEKPKGNNKLGNAYYEEFGKKNENKTTKIKSINFINAFSLF